MTARTFDESGTATLAPEMTSSPSADAPRYELGPWDLSELLASPDAAQARIAKAESRVEALEAARSELGPDLSPERFRELLELEEGLDEEVSILLSYASLWFSQNTQDGDAIAFRDRMRQEVTRLGNRALFFSLWWKQLDEAEAARLAPAGDTMRDRDLRHYLEELRRFTPHTLDEKLEQVINVKDANGISGVLTLYSMLKSRLEFDIEIDGETRTMNEEQMRSLFFSPNPDLRARTYQTIFSTYDREAPVLAQIYSNRVRDWHAENVELRGFSSPIAVRNLGNDVSDRSVETLLDVVHQNAPLFQDYFRMKGRWLGLERMRRYDVYAPLAASEKTIDYGDAVASVLDTFRTFDTDFADRAERVFRENHVDSAMRKGKRGGAFCSTVSPSFTPWVHLNYTGRVRDVATLAHELGHAVHSMLADEHAHWVQHPPLPLAETASVFSEILITDRLLSNETDPTARRELLATAVDDIYATVLRQTFFVRFEIDAHRAVIENATAEDLQALYRRNLDEQFGDALEIADEMQYEFLSIPHLYATPFYCYAYSFGQLLVLALYRRYLAEGKEFKPGYLRLLSYGGSKSPAEALAELGIDIEDASFWQGGFEVVKGWIEELGTLPVS